MISEFGMAVSSDTNIRSRGSLNGGEDPVAMDRPRSEPFFEMLPCSVSKKVGVTGIVMVWRREAALQDRRHPGTVC